MNFIRMKNSSHFRELDDDEKQALRARYAHRGMTEGQKKIADRLLHEMRTHKLWLNCDCIDGKPPVLITRKLDTGIVLANKTKGPLHAENCVMERATLPGEGTAQRPAVRKKPLTKVSYKSIIPRSESSGKKQNPTNRDGKNHFGKKRYSGIARLMLSLIDDTNINRRRLPLPDQGLSDWVPPEELVKFLETNEYYPGRPLAEVIKLDPRLDTDERNKLMAELENKEWRKGEDPTFWVLFKSKDIKSEGAYFSFNNYEYRFEPTKGMSVNGEHADGLREFYWVMARFVRDPFSSAVVCRECYAHAIYSMAFPVPVDSNLERATMKSLSDMSKWVKGKSDELQISMHKPLFDFTVTLEDGEEGYVLPDFMMEITSKKGEKHTLVIETTGYTTEEYIERKQIQHEAMTQLGELLTDPPAWPGTSNTRFGQVLGRHMFPVDERKSKDA
jgi:hypothetical protein